MCVCVLTSHLTSRIHRRKKASAPGTPQICKTLICSEAQPLRISFRERRERTTLPYPTSTERRPEDCFCGHCTEQRAPQSGEVHSCAAPIFSVKRCSVVTCNNDAKFCGDSGKFLCPRHYKVARAAPTYGRPRTFVLYRVVTISATVANPNLQSILQETSPYHDVRFVNGIVREDLVRRGALVDEVPDSRLCDACPPNSMHVYCKRDAFLGKWLCSQHYTL